MGKLKYILLACLMLFVTVSCEDWFHTDYVGNPIRFGISQQYYPKTRTSYSQEYDGRIDWNNGDKVAIYMDWDETRSGSGYAGYPQEMGIYEVYNIRPNSQQSHGRIRNVGGTVLKWKGNFEGNNGRANEFLHTFWSVYPSDTQFDGENFYFKLEDNQNNTDVSDLGLAAYEKDITSATYPNSEGFVEIHYYPMFTTLCVTIDNKANFLIGNSLELFSNDYNIVGNYSVNISERYNDIEGGTINNVSSIFKNGVATFFIIPREYEKDKLYFSLGEKTMSIPETLYPGYKYNITLTTKEVEVEPGFSSFVNGVILAEAHKQGSPFYHGDWEYGEVDGVKKIFGTNTSNNNAWEPVPDELLWEIINGIVDLDVTDTWEMGDTITPEDLNIFPNLQTVKLSGYYKKVEINNPQITEIDITTSEGDGVFNIHDCTSLEKLNIHEGKSVTVKGNGNLTELNVDSQNISDFELDDCDALTTFVVDASPNGNCVKNVKVSNNESLIDFYIKQPTTNDKFYLLAENNDSLTYFEIQQMTGWPPSVDWDAWGLTYRFDIINCKSFKNNNYKVSNNAKTW